MVRLVAVQSTNFLLVIRTLVGMWFLHHLNDCHHLSFPILRPFTLIARNKTKQSCFSILSPIFFALSRNKSFFFFVLLRVLASLRFRQSWFKQVAAAEGCDATGAS